MSEIILISLNGCDDSTEFVINCTAEELDVVKKIETASLDNSSASCQPVLEIIRSHKFVNTSIKADSCQYKGCRKTKEHLLHQDPG